MPPTSGHEKDGMQGEQPGAKAYSAYKKRAVFHDFMKEAVEFYLGMMWNKPPVIEVPPQLEEMLENATHQGESVEQLLRRINEEQLLTGRLGLLLDLPNSAQYATDMKPYIAMYTGESIINWDEGERTEVNPESLNLVVLDESGYERQADLTWDYERIYRVLVLGDVEENEQSGVYRYGIFRGEESEFSEEMLQEVTIKGEYLKKIPFYFINSKDLVPQPDTPPLLSVANLSLAIYRGEADYRQSLFMQGQDTLVVIGDKDEESEKRVGSGASIILPANGDAKFIGVDSQGLSEQRQALENDKKLIGYKTGQLINTGASKQESGEALEKRIGSQTATLRQIAMAGAGGLEKVLKEAAIWMGADPEKVIITPNTEFATEKLAPQDLVQYMSAKSLGAPISKQTIHENMRSKGMTDKEFDEEMKLLEEEADSELEVPGGTGVEDDNEDENENNGDE